MVVRDMAGEKQIVLAALEAEGHAVWRAKDGDAKRKSLFYAAHHVIAVELSIGSWRSPPESLSLSE
jgi:hypothetical protein